MALTFGGKKKPGGTPPRFALSPFEQIMTDRIAAALRELALSVDIEAFIEAIEALDPDLLESLLNELASGFISARLEAALREVAASTATAQGEAAAEIAPNRSIERDKTLFNRVDQRTADYAANRSSGLIVEINQSNRLAVRRVIAGSFTSPYTVDETARRLRKMVGLHTRWANAVLKFDDANVVRLIKDGYSPDEARARADVLTKRYRDKLIRRRAEMIARTEIQQAENFGRQAGWEAGNFVGYIDGASMKEWRTAPLRSQYGPPCEECMAVRGTRVPWNGAFSNGFMFPPAHPHCRCTVVLVPPSRGLEGLPSQDMASWLERLDQMYADEGAL